VTAQSSGAGQPLSSILGQLDKELRELWSTPPAPGEPAKSRVCTMNLLVVTSAPEIADRYVRIVDEVTQTTPARSIIVTMDPDAKDSVLEGEVSGVCAIGEGGAQQVCSERITLRAKGAATARVASAVDALLVAEIPTALIWLGRVHTHDPLFADLAKNADRIILDTEYTSLSSLLSLGKWTRAMEGRPKVADIAWTRLSTWQEMCARFFDDPAHRIHSRNIEELEIAQASEKGARLGSECSLLLGWLATRLEWRMDRLGGALRFRRPDGQRVAVKLLAVPRPFSVAPNALAGVAVVAKAGDVVLRGSIRRSLGTGHPGEPAGDLNEPPPYSQTLDADVLQWRLEVGDQVIEQSIRLGANRGSRLLDRTLHRPAHDPLLEEAVAFAEELFEDGLVAQ
jgi:glucose-6-phosphate dehydrogenase assembly protein OpcA